MASSHADADMVTPMVIERVVDCGSAEKVDEDNDGKYICNGRQWELKVLGSFWRPWPLISQAWCDEVVESSESSFLRPSM